MLRSLGRAALLGWVGWHLLTASAAWGAAPSSYDLYRAGRASESVAAAKADLSTALANGTPGEQWQHAMHVAWLEESIGHHREAMRYAKTALDLANTSGNPFQIGRSLSWLGWSATSLGLYPLALEFYDAAIDHATESDGNVVIPMVWGLATQEKGSLLATMGDLDGGSALIEMTTDFARRHQILVGVAEGGAHLARIALERGDWAEATERAEEAIQAAEECGCSAFNTHRARLTLARVLLERSTVDPRYRSDAEAQMRLTLRDATKMSDRRHAAEAQLLLSRLVDRTDLDQRVALVKAAAASLHSMESELRGNANARLGSLMLEADEIGLAGFYLTSGFSINEELLRKLDSAFILGDLAELNLLEGDPNGHLEKWMDAADQAEASGAWPLAAESQEAIAETLYEMGFSSLSRHWSGKALDSIERILENTRDAERRKELEWRRLALYERIVEIDIALDHSPAPLAGGAGPASPAPPSSE